MGSPSRKLEPDQVDREIVYLLGLGYTAVKVAKKREVTVYAIYQRLKRLFDLSGTHNQAHLVYWMLDKEYINYSPIRGKRRLPKPPDFKLAVVELIARGHTQEAIGRKLSLSPWGVDRRAREVRAVLHCKTQAQMVAICWTEDWIV